MTPQDTPENRAEQGEGAPSYPTVRRSSGRRRKGRGGRRKNTREFMDVADDAYAYQIAMSVWRDAEAVLGASPSPEVGLNRLLEAGDFESRGEYAPIWQKRWREAAVRAVSAETAAGRLEILHEAVTKSIEEENEARALAGQPPVIDEKEGQKFIDDTVDWMLEDSDGEVEDEIDDEEEIEEA